MNRQKCRVTRQEIDQSELNHGLSDQTLGHLASCASCSQFRDERTKLRELVGDFEPVTAPADFDVRLRARIAAQRQGNGYRPFFERFAVGTPAIAVAALVIMGVASVVWFTQRNPNEGATVSTQDNRATTTQPDKPIVDAGKGEEKRADDVVSPDHHGPARSDNASSSRPVKAKATQPPGSRGKSVDSALRAADVIRQNRNPGEVSLNAPDKPMVFSMQDDRGMTRKFSLPPVSFGSQRLVDNRLPVSSTNTRIW